VKISSDRKTGIFFYAPFSTWPSGKNVICRGLLTFFSQLFHLFIFEEERKNFFFYYATLKASAKVKVLFSSTN
jgi:hypothetical protein